MKKRLRKTENGFPRTMYKTTNVAQKRIKQMGMVGRMLRKVQCAQKWPRVRYDVK